MPDIVVIGSVVADLIARVRHAPRAGETVVADDLTIAPGGKGANQAAIAARLGGDVALVATVGDDAFGEQCRASLVDAGVDMSHVLRAPGEMTGCGFVVLDATGENRIVFTSGANARTDVARIEEARSLISSAKVTLLQLELSLDTAVLATRIAKDSGTRVILNPAPASAPLQHLPPADVLVPNEVEAAQLTGVPINDDRSLVRAADTLRAAGFPEVVVTRGEQGASVFDSEWSLVEIPARPAEVVDTTGAGDGFVGGLAWALCEGLDLSEAAEVGAAAAAEVVGSLGAQPSIDAAVVLDRA